MKFLYTFLTSLLVAIAVSKIIANSEKSELPSYIINDDIALNHHTKINFDIQSQVKPSPVGQEQLLNDYKNIWAHLNHLYTTNEVSAGKKYYTEEFFDALCRQFQKSPQWVQRHDREHHLILTHYSRNGLLAILHDSLVILEYDFPNQQKRIEKVEVAIALIYQGEHWRLDALNIKPIKRIKKL